MNNANEDSISVHFRCAVLFSVNTFLCPNGKGDHNVTFSPQFLVLSAVMILAVRLSAEISGLSARVGECCEVTLRRRMIHEGVIR